LTITNAAVADTPTGLSLSVTSLSSSTDSSSYISKTSNLVNGNDYFDVPTVDGVNYTLSFDYTGTQTFDVYYAGEKLGTVNGATTNDTTHSFTVAGTGIATDDITFVSTDGSPVTTSGAFMAPMENMLQYNVDLSAHLVDTDGSESLTIVLSGLPADAVLSVGQAGSTAGTWEVTPASGQDLSLSGVKMFVPESSDAFTLTATATATDSNGTQASVSTTASVVDVTLNSAATSTNDSVTLNEDTTYVIKSTDLGTFNDVNGDSLTGIKITSLPDSNSGELRLLGQDNQSTADGSVAVTSGMEISISDINMGNLVFIPKANSDADSSFGFRVGDGSSYSTSSYTTTVNVTAVADAPTLSLSIGSVTGGSTPVLENFSSGLNGYSGTDVTLDNGKMKVDSTTGATKTYTGFPGNTEVTISLTLDVYGNNSAGSSYRGWEASDSGKDVFNVAVNDTVLKANKFSNNLLTSGDGFASSAWTSNNSNTETSTVTFTARTDSNGNLKLNLRDNSTASDEYALIDNINITYSNPYVYPVTIVSGSSSDIDGSESLGTVTLTGIPSGATLTDGLTTYAVSNGSASIPTGTKNLTMIVPESSPQNFTLSASVTSTELRGGDTETVTVSATSVPPSVTDTAPTAMAEAVTVDVTNIDISNVTTPVTNLVLTVDVSGSMSTAVGSSTRLALTKTALKNAIDSYDGMGDVNVKVIKFSDTGTASEWMTATAAKAYIDGLSAGGYTNYEDASYKTALNYAATEPEADKTVSIFISDGEPTKENNQGTDVSGNVGTDGTSGWLDASYQQGWNTFVNEQVDELMVIGIGTGLSNFAYLDALASAVPGASATQVSDVTQLAAIINPATTTVTGNILDNVTFGADGAAAGGGLTSITIDGTTYTAAQLASGVTTTQGFLVVNPQTGAYSIKVTDTTAVDSTKTMSVKVTDGDGSTTNFNFTVTVNETTVVAPDSPVVTSIVDNTADSDKSTVIVSGTALANSTVALIIDGTQVGTTTANGSGQWSANVDVTNGMHSLVTTATLNDLTSSKSDPSTISVNNAFVSTTGDGADYVAVDSTALTAKTGAGNDMIVGGTGSDTVEFTGNKADYTITYNAVAGTYTVTDLRAGSPDGTDTIKGIESLKFADQTIAPTTYTTPLVLDLDGDGIQTINIDQGVQFDINADGSMESVGWVSSGDGLLTFDRNADGTVNDGSELFGSAFQLADGSLAQDGFEALASLDGNADGTLDANDSAWGSLQVWKDTNTDGVSGEGEMFSLNDLGISSLSLANSASNDMNNGNIVGLEGSYTTTDGNTHEMSDVWFETQQNLNDIQTNAKDDLFNFGDANMLGGADWVSQMGDAGVGVDHARMLNDLDRTTMLDAGLSPIEDSTTLGW
jgi:hypothetical protein